MKKKKKPWYQQDRQTWKIRPTTKIKGDERDKLKKEQESHERYWFED